MLYLCPWYIIVHRGAKNLVANCTATKTLTSSPNLKKSSSSQ